MRGSSFINLVILLAAIWCFSQLYSLGHEAIAITGKAMTQAMGVTR